jgi:hypothetical protein
MPDLYLKCKTCKTEFAPGMSFDKKSFETSILASTTHMCPNRHVNKYDKKDYYFK